MKILYIRLHSSVVQIQNQWDMNLKMFSLEVHTVATVHFTSQRLNVKSWPVTMKPTSDSEIGIAATYCHIQKRVKDKALVQLFALFIFFLDKGKVQIS